ncbi:TPA: chromosomal replication initiator protein DnaA [Candidatus Avigastranaerophilus faecigallinarum]|nr:chromosomal replication initiator protein DnaA [Candidatus Avigastranaerophilus faecigallinarum]
MEDELIKQIWNDALVILKDTVITTTYETWILPLVPHSLEDNCFCALTGQNLAVQILQKNQKEISKALSEVCGKEVYFKVIYDDNLHKQLEKEKQKAKKDEEKEFIQNLEKRIASSKYDGLKQMRSDCNLNLKYKFDNFVVGANNKFAHAVALAVAKDPGKQYNPLFIYGGSGLGKTHLLQAIGHDVLFHKPKLKVKYVKAEEFINDLVNSLVKGMDKAGDKNKKMNDFRNKYRNVDVLLVDDIQLIEGKARTEEEMFNTFESLHNSGKQIVFTSDRSPDKFENTPDRLKTRFQMGLLADIQVPDIETRMAILTKLANDNNIKMPIDVIEFLATVYNKNVRELEGAFNTVSAYTSINEIPITVEIVKKVIGYSEKRKTVTVEGIIDIVAGFYNVSVDDIKSTNRAAKTAYARQVAIYLAKELTGESFPYIGDCFNRKHTTIMYSHQKVKSDIAIDRHLAQDITELTSKINE